MMRTMSDQRPYTVLGDRIRELREATGLSQTTFAIKVTEALRAADSSETATQPAVSLWERGLHAPSSPKLRAIALVTNSSWFELLELKEQLDAELPALASETAPAGYDTRISKLPEELRRAIDAIIDTHEEHHG